MRMVLIKDNIYKPALSQIQIGYLRSLVPRVSLGPESLPSHRDAKDCRL